VSLSAIPNPIRVAVFGRDDGRCRYCMLHQFGQVAVFHINHVIPRSRGGLTTLDNLVLQCPYCSLHKSDKISAVDPKTREVVSLFHPLQQIWGDHFTMLEDGMIAGKTAVGRATIEALAMTDSIPSTARFLQRILGILKI
jgi:5-methylcytosine-specific restriction endonuclease McrA